MVYVACCLRPTDKLASAVPLLVFLCITSLLNFSFSVLATAVSVPLMLLASLVPAPAHYAGRLLKLLLLLLLHPLTLVALWNARFSLPIPELAISLPESLSLTSPLPLSLDEPILPSTPSLPFFNAIALAYRDHSTLLSPFFHVFVPYITIHIILLAIRRKVE